MDATVQITTQDKDVLRRLAERKAQIAADPVNDVHTINNEPERLARWVQIAREEIKANGR
jgi:hypothetical protein